MTDSLFSRSVPVSRTQPWLRSPSFDLLYIAAPAFLTSIIALACKDNLENMKTLPLWAWVTFVLLIDVAHVYATLYRTYFDPEALRKNGTVLCVVPLACWAVGTMLYSVSALLFWRCLAYLAVFHFIRQQYGFVALYSRNRNDNSDAPAELNNGKWGLRLFEKFKFVDMACIYLSMLYPLMFWHTNLPRNFNWFVEGDFLESMPATLASYCLVLYVVVALTYLFKEFFILLKTGYINVPKNLIIIGTALSWWVAIVAINSDFSFTMINVISHGVPYMALIWIYHRYRANSQPSANGVETRASAEGSPFLGFVMNFAPAFVVSLCLLAYLEEGFWAGLVWREHLEVFRPFSGLPLITDAAVLAVLIPLLSLPQSTHYVLDGFIWRVKDRKSVWSTKQ